MNAVLQIAAAFCSTLAFAVVFNAPRRQLVHCGVTGALSWVIYLAVMAWTDSPVTATFTAAVVASLAARILSIRRKMPATIFIVSGIITLVPGAGVYHTVYALIRGELQYAAVKGLETVKLAVVIAMGIAIVMSLPFGRSGPRRSRREKKGI